jgi:Fe-S cluster assembly ATP-binding protein
MLEIKELTVTVEGKEILKNFSLSVKPGEIHAIMGPNGAGKSTLAKVLAGHPSYEVVSGKALFNGIDLLELDPEERAKLGLFMSFQYPLEIRGISNFEFLKHAYGAIHNVKIEDEEFKAILDPIVKKMKIKETFLERDLNDGFSGGEKKRNEILQMLVLNPKLGVLDETDSGLDIDALKIIGEGVNHFMAHDKMIILITHYQRLLNYIRPHFVHVMIDGKIVESGGPELALQLEEKGYEACSKKD